MPFVQGQIRGQPLSCTVQTECGHCRQPLTLVIDSKLEIRVLDEGADPRVYVPLVDLAKLEEPSIIDSF